jgi:hypothetical protein
MALVEVGQTVAVGLVDEDRRRPGSVVFRDLRGLPEFIELSSDERIESSGVILRQGVYADQLDRICQVLESMGSRHSTGDLQFKQCHQIDVGQTFVMNFPY